MKKKLLSLEQFKIYSLLHLNKAGYKCGKLRINRNLNENDIRKKIKSLEISKGSIAPGIIVTARQVLEEGLQLLDENGNSLDLTHKEIDCYIVIIDGQHRTEAIKRINDKAKQNLNKAISKATTSEEKEIAEKIYKESIVDMYVMLPLNPEIKVITLLEEVNVATRPWNGIDFLTKILNTQHDSINVEPLKWIKEHMECCSETAAKLWGSMDASKSFSKSQLIKAGADAEKLKSLVEMNDHQFGIQIYEAAHTILGIDIVKLKSVPNWVIGKLSQLSVDMSKKEATEIIVSFFNNMEPILVATIKGAKKSDSRTKEQVITAELSKAWEKFISSRTDETLS